MAVNYRISQEADIDLHKATCYFGIYGKDIEFMDDFLEILKLIRQFPEAFAIKYLDFRVVGFNNFNYAVHYEILPDYILIYRILNQTQEY